MDLPTRDSIQGDSTRSSAVAGEGAVALAISNANAPPLILSETYGSLHTGNSKAGGLASMRRIVLIGGIFLGAANLASAQVASPILLSGKISEKYSDRTQISGVRIVGLMLGDVSMPLDYGNLRFSLPGLPEQRTICFAATSRDGLYSAAGSLSAPAGTRGLAAVSHTSTMHRQLAAYRSGDIVMRAHIGPECATSRNAPLIPLRYGSKGQVLQVAVNSVNAVGVSASLTLTNGQTISGVCSRERTGAAFDHICRLNIPERVSGRSKLILNYRERTLEQRKESVSVQW